ncbi:MULTISPECIES: SctK family type III secretion system sorting platform protein [Achromobacter]|uniref:SctK family type III secretion system sorting platform protein n=1 Tax=Achromobacter denitrificans TaxID=32002 RepID=A0A6N0JRI5_ACHDE|nr:MULTISPECIES: SctK family type III secretion system sorting platform protein [Achromobacter]MDF3861846.1 SctK family type III secretion system sorting platform protein [Achromobacter denitrificans]QKQ49735.1 SctK family type III secretion system sorting platform protein [Achromobacter denitrificans]
MEPAASALGRRLVEFNQLPSRTLHPSRLAAFAPAAALETIAATPALDAAWHRHWSRDILRGLGLLERPVTDAGRPELALALLAPEALAQCARRLGAVLCGPRLRRAIAGDEVRLLIAGLGADLMDFARRTAAGLHAGLPESAAWPAGQAAAAVDALGHGALRAALSGAGPELLLRAELKLPDLPAQDFPLPAADALSLGLSILKNTDPTWHSSFPAIR